MTTQRALDREKQVAADPGVAFVRVRGSHVDHYVYQESEWREAMKYDGNPVPLILGWTLILGVFIFGMACFALGIGIEQSSAACAHVPDTKEKP